MSKTNSDGSHKADSRFVAQAEVKRWTFTYFVMNFRLLEDCIVSHWCCATLINKKEKMGSYRENTGDYNK